MKWSERYLPAVPQWEPEDTGDYVGNIGAAESVFYTKPHNEPPVGLWQKKAAMGRGYVPQSKKPERLRVKRRASSRSV